MPQINELTTRTFDGDSLIGFDVENTDPQTQAQYPYVTGKADGNALADFIANEQEYVTDLNTVDKHLTGAINELHTINGYSYDAYDDTATYAVGDLCIYNNALYKCTTAITTAEAWNANHWTAMSIANEISAKADNISTLISVTPNSKLTSDGRVFAKFGKVITLSAVFRAQNNQILASEAIWIINNQNLLTSDEYYIPTIIDGTSGYGYLVAKNDGNNIKIFSNTDIQMPRLMFINGVLPIV